MKFSKRTIGIIIIGLLVYLIIILLWARIWHWDYYFTKQCCGSYLEHKMYYLPFPTMVDPVWGDGSKEIYWIGVILNSLLVLVIIAFSIARARKIYTVADILVDEND